MKMRHPERPYQGIAHYHGMRLKADIFSSNLY